MSTPTELATQSKPLDNNTRLALLGIGTALGLLVLVAGMTIFVMVVNNWNFLSWFE